MVLRGIYNQPPRTTRPPAKVSHLDDPVPEDVDDLGLTPAHYPLALRPAEVNVPVQPQGGLVAVYEPEEGLEAYVGLVLGVAEAERRGVGDEYTRYRRPASLRHRMRAESALARRRIWRSVYWFGPPEYSREPESPARTTPSPSTIRPSSGGNPRGTRAVGEGSWLPRTVDRHAEEGDDVVQVVERQVAAGDHSLHPQRKT